MKKSLSFTTFVSAVHAAFGNTLAIEGEDYTPENQQLLLKNGWTLWKGKEAGTHDGPLFGQSITTYSEDGLIGVSLYHDILFGVWRGTIVLSAPWSKEWSDERKMGFLDAYEIPSNPENLSSHRGRPVCVIMVDGSGLLVVRLEVRGWTSFHLPKVLPTTEEQFKKLMLPLDDYITVDDERGTIGALGRHLKLMLK